VADPRLNELERRWRESGAFEDEVAYLALRLRLGAIVRGRVELAAFLEHPAAIAVAGRQEHRLQEVQPLFTHWCSALQAWGSNASIRAAVAHLRVSLAALRTDTQEGTRSAALRWVLDTIPVVEQRTDLVEEWLAARSDAAARARVVGLAGQVPEVGERPADRRSPDEGEFAPPSWEGRCYQLLESTLRISDALRTQKPPRWWRGLDVEHRPLAEAAAVIAPIRAELVPWALRSRDAVKARVAERGGSVDFGSGDTT